MYTNVPRFCTGYHQVFFDGDQVTRERVTGAQDAKLQSDDLGNIYKKCCVKPFSTLAESRSCWVNPPTVNAVFSILKLASPETVKYMYSCKFYSIAMHTH